MQEAKLIALGNCGREEVGEALGEERGNMADAPTTTIKMHKLLDPSLSK